MMRFHPPSFVLGVGTAVALMSKKQHFRPVIVELAALGLHLGKLALALVERQREHGEDLWAEIAERARHKAERASWPAARKSNGAAEIHVEPRS
jgi:hypothetical protein